MPHRKLSLFALSFLTLTLGCGKDKSPTDSSVPETPDRVFVERITIQEIPFTDGQGAGWDLLTGPDVFAEFGTNSNIVFSLRPNYRLDVSPSDLPIQWSLATSYEITNWSTNFFVYIWDYDETGDDYIGAPNGFSINSIIAVDGYVTSVTKENSAGTIRAVVTLRWQ